MAKNILICDDAAFMRMMIKDILTKNGYNIAGEAENGAKAVEKYAELKPDLVLMDITMPEMDGIQALKKIRESDPNAAIIMCSAMGQQAMVIKSWAKSNKVPKSRESFIKFGMGLRYNFQEINFILQRYGKYPKLYSKSLEDAICIYVISHYPKDENVNAYETYLNMKEKFLDVLKTKNKRRYLNDSKNKTIDVEQIIINMSDDEELFDFIRKNEVEFFNSYYKLIDYIESYVKAESVGGSYHSLVKDENLDKGFEKMISNLKNWGEVPNRNRLIALGIKLNMTGPEINQLLNYANMEKLCPKDKIECIILYVLANIDIANPYYQMNHMSIAAQYTENPEMKNKCESLLMELTGLRESEEIREDVEFYIKDALESLDMEDEENGILQLFLEG